MFVPKGTDDLQKAIDQVDSVIRQVQAKKKPVPLPDFKYVSNTAEGFSKKSFEKATGKGSKAVRQLFGEIEDPR